jgi:hypothetical protein
MNSRTARTYLVIGSLAAGGVLSTAALAGASPASGTHLQPRIEDTVVTDEAMTITSTTTIDGAATPIVGSSATTADETSDSAEKATGATTEETKATDATDGSEVDDQSNDTEAADNGVSKSSMPQVTDTQGSQQNRQGDDEGSDDSGDNGSTHNGNSEGD